MSNETLSRKPLRQTLIESFGYTEDQADSEIGAARSELYERLAQGEMPYDFCAEWFGLEPDYLEDLLF